jgi:hypothetical protein
VTPERTEKSVIIQRACDLPADQRPKATAAGSGPLLLTLSAFSVRSAQHRFLRRGSDSRRTQLRDPFDQLHGNRFDEREADCPLSQLITP